MHSHEDSHYIKELEYLVSSRSIREKLYNSNTQSNNTRKARFLVLDSRTNKLSIKYKNSGQDKRYSL